MSVSTSVAIVCGSHQFVIAAYLAHDAHALDLPSETDAPTDAEHCGATICDR